MTSQPKPGEVLNGEWIEWTGGSNPVPDQAVEVKIRWRNGEPSEGSTMSDNMEWRHFRKGHGDGGDIIAYRISRPLEPSGGQDGGGEPASVIDMLDVFERPYTDLDDPRLQCARVLTRAEAGAVLEHRGDIIQALASPAKVSGWQGIETAPRDERVLIFRPSEFLEDRIFTAYLDDLDWWSVHDGKHDHHLRGNMPTHWMSLDDLPLPPRPEDEGAGA